jgi:hypothetical protein
MDIKITLTQEQVAQIIRDNKRNSSPDLETYSITGAAKTSNQQEQFTE